MTLYLDGVEVKTGIFEADAVRNILDLELSWLQVNSFSLIKTTGQLV